MADGLVELDGSRQIWATRKHMRMDWFRRRLRSRRALMRLLIRLYLKAITNILIFRSKTTLIKAF